MRAKLTLPFILLALGCSSSGNIERYGLRDDQSPAVVSGWLDWRGPLQAGVSLETGLPDAVTLGGENHLWSYELAGRGTPVIANGRVYAMGYEGEDADLQELLVCLDEKTGEKIFERRHSDFISDIVYDRYSISSPTVDPATGNVYYLTSPGLLFGITADGETLWEQSLMSTIGRPTYPNGRTGAPVIDGDLVILHSITSSWGPNGPRRDRFHAFDKATGEVVWGSTPGGPPKDSPYSHPVLDWRDGERVLYSGTGCGYVVCVNARTGEPIWRYKLVTGGINSSVVVHGGDVIAIHARENTDSSKIGGILRISTEARNALGEGPVELDAESEVWRNDLVAFTSSPVLVGERLYQTVATGELACVDVNTGEILWHEKLAPDQIHASPLAADGKLYVPMNNGSFHIVRPTDEGPELLSEVQLEGACLGAPSVWNGRIYVHTTKRLYCFGTGDGETVAPPPATDAPSAGVTAQLQIVPADALLRVGEPAHFLVRGLDAKGQFVAGHAKGVGFGPPPFLDEGEGGAFVATRPGTGVLSATFSEIVGSARVRAVPALPYEEDFESFTLTPHPNEEGATFARPPSHWIGAGVMWDVREAEGGKVLAKTIANPLFQRAMSFIGHPDDANYTMQIDVMTDGNRRSMSTAGIVNQRYLIQLKGNYQTIEVSSNDWRVKESVPFKWKANVWYTLKTRVDVAEDGSGVVRAKAWKRGDPEPDAWNIEVPHKDAHENGSPGLFGLAPQSRFKVYVDNISVTPNE